MPVTVYTPSPVMSANDNNTGANFRVFVKLTGASNGQLRVRFRSSNATNGLTILGAAFGKWNGTAISASSSDMTTTPFRLTFASANTIAIGINSTATSDLITHGGLTLASGDWVIVTFYNANTTATAGQRLNTAGVNATTMFKFVLTDWSQAQTAAAMGNGLTIVGSAQPGGAAGINYCIDLVETNDPAGGAKGIPLFGMQRRFFTRRINR